MLRGARVYQPKNQYQRRRHAKSCRAVHDQGRGRRCRRSGLAPLGVHPGGGDLAEPPRACVQHHLLCESILCEQSLISEHATQD